jgi:hypothetical protein
MAIVIYAAKAEELGRYIRQAVNIGALVLNR